MLQQKLVLAYITKLIDKGGSKMILIDQDNNEEVTFKELHDQKWRLVRESPMGGAVSTGSSSYQLFTPFVSLLVFENID